MPPPKKDVERAQLLDDFDDSDEDDLDAFRDTARGPTSKQASGSGGNNSSNINTKTSSTTGATATGSNDKLKRVQSQVTEVIDVMHQNIDKVLERGVKLEEIEDRTDALAEHSRNFSSRSRQLRRRMWWNNLKLQLMLCGICTVILFIIIVSVVASRK